MEIIVVFAGQGLPRNIEAVNIACQTRGLFHGNGMGYARFKKHATNFNGISDGRLGAPRFIPSGRTAASPIKAICKASMKPTAWAYFFIFKTSGGPVPFTTEDRRHGANFRCYTESSASVRHFEKTSHLRRAIPEYRAIGARLYSRCSQG